MPKRRGGIIMKKVVSLLMVLAMVAASCFALTSCGKKAEQSDLSQQENETVVASTEEN